MLIFCRIKQGIGPNKNEGYVIEHCGLFYRTQLRIAVFASFFFNRKARQEKKTPRTQRKK